MTHGPMRHLGARERNSQFSHLTEAVVNVAMPSTNETQFRTPQQVP